MSLVITTNKDQDSTFRQDQSIYSAWSYKNSLSSVYKVPANSQVALQSCKVNLDGRLTITGNNSWWYDYFGLDLSLVDNSVLVEGASVAKIDLTTSHPILQDLQVGKGEILELTTDELASRITREHAKRDYHPNLKNNFSCVVERNSGLDFLGFTFNYGQSTLQTYSQQPLTMEKFYTDNNEKRFSYSYVAGGSTITRLTGEHEDPCVGIGLGTPLSLSNGLCQVDFATGAGTSAPWGIGLSRDCPAWWLDQNESYAPYYYDEDSDLNENYAMGLDHADFFEDFGVHKNADGELVLRHAVNIGGVMVMREVKYWLNGNSKLKGAGRYDLDTNANKYDWVKFVAVGEQMEVYMGNASLDDLITKYDGVEPKESYLKPITQTCWCLHPVLFVGYDTANQTNKLTIEKFSGIPIADYDSRAIGGGGWFENLSMISAEKGFKPMAYCRAVDERLILDPTKTSAPFDYAPKGLSNNGVDLKYAMILSPNKEYAPSFGASCADLFGFPGRSLVLGATSGTFPSIQFSSDEPTSLNSMLSVFVRLNGFGQQVVNARTGNQSTILSHLPTADSRQTDGSSQRIFYEPKNLIWLDLKNAYELQVSEFNLDFVYSNEQYAKILQGQSIVCLYFRKDPLMKME
tara:strand:+ start:1067 stop:2962 length:1896 start_codon:yes stop_codon:yes gene_type:complete